MASLLDKVANARPEVRWLGTMSGTSGDGLDIARVTLQETDDPMLPRVCSIQGDTFQYDSEFATSLRGAVESQGSFEVTAHWDRQLGEMWGEMISDSIDRFGDVDAITLAGHTFFHRGSSPPITLQLGAPHTIAQKTGKPVLFGFRGCDLSLGGEGAPLVPVGDRVLFGELADRVAVVNIGGISNVTWIEKDRELQARDAGPGNLLLDEVWRAAKFDESRFDENGRVALSGSVDRSLLGSFKDHPWRERRSLGREQFGQGWFLDFREQLSLLSLEDRLATLCAWIAGEIAETIVELSEGRAPQRLLVGGGGAHHRRLLQEIDRFVGISAEPLQETKHGVGADLREAAAFAILGHEWLYGRSGSFLGTTGATPGAGLGMWAFPA